MPAAQLDKSIPWDANLHNYLCKTGGIDTPELAALRDLAARHARGEMQTTAQQGQLLFFLMRLIGAKKVVELGVFLGYGTLAIALALPKDGLVIAADIDPDVHATASVYWQRAGVADKIDFRPCSATDLLRHLADAGTRDLDCVFIDADKAGYANYYEMALPLLRPGGLLILDNMLWRGRVAAASVTEEPQHSIAQLNQHIKDDGRVDMCLLPLADGMLLVHKKI